MLTLTRIIRERKKKLLKHHIFFCINFETNKERKSPQKRIYMSSVGCCTTNSSNARSNSSGQSINGKAIRSDGWLSFSIVVIDDCLDCDGIFNSFVLSRS